MRARVNAARRRHRQYADMSLVTLAEEIRRRGDSVSILVDAELLMTGTLWHLKTTFGAERDLKRFLAQFEGAAVTFAIGTKTATDIPSPRRQGATVVYPGALSPPRGTPAICSEIEFGEMEVPVPQTERTLSLGAFRSDFTCQGGTMKHHEQEGAALREEESLFGAGLTKSGSQGVPVGIGGPPLKTVIGKLCKTFDVNDTAVRVMQASLDNSRPRRCLQSQARALDFDHANGLKQLIQHSNLKTIASGPRAPERVIMAPLSRPLKPLALKATRERHPPVVLENNVDGEFAKPKGAKCLLMEPQVIKPPTKTVATVAEQPGSRGLDLADPRESRVLSSRSVKANSATRSFFIEVANACGCDVIEIDEDPGQVGETAAYTRKVALAADAHPFTYAVVGGADFLCFNFLKSYDVRFTDTHPYTLASTSTTPFRASEIAKTMDLKFKGLILFTCALGNRFCKQSHRIFHRVSSGRERSDRLDSSEQRLAQEAVDAIKEFERDGTRTQLQYVSFGERLTGHTSKYIEASLDYYGLTSSASEYDWNSLAANKSETSKPVERPNWRRGPLRRPQITQSKPALASRLSTWHSPPRRFPVKNGFPQAGDRFGEL